MIFKIRAIMDSTEALLRHDGELYPFAPENVEEALTSVDFRDLAKLLQAENHEAAGRMVREKVYKYWEDVAMARAEKESGYMEF
jgi:hypothetical protein